MPPRNFALVADQIYRGGEPSLQDIKLLKDVYRIKRVISLDQNSARKIAPWLRNYQIEHLILPVNAGLARFDDSLTYLIRNIQVILPQKQPVYIHCLHGQDRTGLIIAAYRIKKQGWSYDQALNEAKKYGFGNGIPANVRTFYLNILKTLGSKGDVSAADDSIVDITRDDLARPQPPAFLPQQSWAPYQPRSMGEDDRISRSDILDSLLERINDPTSFYPSGVRVESTPLRGAGPIENSGVFSFSSYKQQKNRHIK